MLKIAVFTIKGGVGKTSVTELLAISFALKGKRILLIDTDLQAHLSREMLSSRYYSFAVNNGNKGFGSFVLSPNDKPVPVSVAPNIDILPMEKDAFKYIRLDMAMSKLSYLKDLDYDYVLIDTPPSYDNVVSFNLLTSIDAYYTVVTPALQSIETVKLEITDVIPDLINKMKSPPKLIGIILNRNTTTRSKEIMRMLDELNSQCYSSPIPKYIPCMFENNVGYSAHLMNHEIIISILASGDVTKLKSVLQKLNITSVSDEFENRIQALFKVNNSEREQQQLYAEAQHTQ